MKRTPLEVFDTHIHTEFASPGAFEGYCNIMRTHGVVGALTDSTRPGASANALSSRMIFRCAVVGPSSGALEDLRVDIDAGVYRAIKINLGFLHKYPDDHTLLPLYQLAASKSLPLFFHTGDTGWSKSKLKFAHPLAIDELATDYQNLQIVLVHAGNPWFVDAALVASKNDNVSLEISAILGGNIANASQSRVETMLISQIRYVVEYVNDPKKIIFGSGWPMVDFESYLDACLRAIPSAHWDAMFRDNAMALLKIPRADASRNHATN